jgi:hypothetical protein
MIEVDKTYNLCFSNTHAGTRTAAIEITPTARFELAAYAHMPTIFSVVALYLHVYVYARISPHIYEVQVLVSVPSLH